MTDAVEMVLAVDEHDQPVGVMPRARAKADNHWTRSAHVWVYNADGQILCHKRSLSKDRSPGLWTSSLGGHLSPDEDYTAAAAREVAEEIGIELLTGNLTLYKILKIPHGRDYGAIFGAQSEADSAGLKFDPAEIDQLCWYDTTQLRQVIHSRHPCWVHLGHELEVLDWLEYQLLSRVV